MQRSTVPLWAGGGAFFLAAIVHPKRWVDDGLASASIETLALLVAGALIGAAAAVVRTWIARRGRPD